MKVLFTFLLVLFLAACFSQANKIELYDLIRSFAVDSANPYNGVAWTDAALKNPNITWENNGPVAKGNAYTRKGAAAIAIYGKTFSCDKMNPCPFKIYFEGNQSGYNKFSIDHNLSLNFKPEQSIAFLFNRNLKFRLYKKNADKENAAVYTYEIKFEGKKPMWLMYGCINTANGNGIYLKGYLDENDLNENSQTEPVATSKDQKLTTAAAKLFKGVKTKLSNEDKNDIQKLTDFNKGDGITVYPTDLNKDGIEEIFIRLGNFEMYGDDGRTNAYIKNAGGKYIYQDAMKVGFLSTRVTSSKGYPDLLAGGRGFKFMMFRWNGNKYEYYKNNEAPVQTDIDISDVSDAYLRGVQPAGYNDKKAIPEITEKSSGEPIGANTLDFLTAYQVEQKDFFSNKNFELRLKKLMGNDYGKMMQNWDLSTPAVIENGLFYLWGMQEHMGGENETVILGDIPHNKLYVKLLKDRKPYYFSEDGSNIIPVNILNWMNEVYKRGRQ